MARSFKNMTLRERRNAIIKKTTPHLMRVGQVASLWSQVELYLDMIIWALLQTEQKLAACATSQLISPYTKLRTIKALLDIQDIKTKPTALQKTLNKLGSDIEAVYMARNRAVHDTWQASTTTKRVFQMRAAVVGNVLKFGQEKVTVRELDRTLSKIRKLLWRVHDFEQAVKREIPWLSKPAPARFSRIESSRSLPSRRGIARKKRTAQQKASKT